MSFKRMRAGQKSLIKPAENAGDSNANGRWHCRQKIKYFNFLPFSATELAIWCYVTPKMPHARRKHVWSPQWQGDHFSEIIPGVTWSLELQSDLCMLDDLSGLLFVWIDCSEREGCAGWARLTFNEREGHTAQSIYKFVSTETFCAYRDTSQTEIVFSSTSVSVNFCNCKVNQKLKYCAAPGGHDVPNEEWHREICQKLACSPRS